MPGWLRRVSASFQRIMIRQLGLTADIYGAARMVVIYTIGGAVGFLCSSIAGYVMPLPIIGGSQLTDGASAPIFGLLGGLMYAAAAAATASCAQRSWATWSVPRYSES